MVESAPREAKREGFESGRNGPCPENGTGLREVKRFAKWKDKSNGRKARRNGVERRLAASGDRARKRELIVQPYPPTLRKRQRQKLLSLPRRASANRQAEQAQGIKI